MNTTLTYRNIDYLKRFPDITLVFQKFYNYPNEIQKDVDSLLTKYNNNIQAIIANTDEIALQAVEVLKKKNLEKKIITVGAGCSPEAVKSILNGELTMSVDMGYENLGKKALTAAVDMMNLIPLKDDGLKYKNDEQKVSWILSTVKSYDKRNIKYIFDVDKKYDKSKFGLK
jgi:ABC-type sugar transport system substrate-binding protein